MLFRSLSFIPAPSIAFFDACRVPCTSTPIASLAASAVILYVSVVLSNTHLPYVGQLRRRAFPPRAAPCSSHPAGFWALCAEKSAIVRVIPCTIVLSCRLFNDRASFRHLGTRTIALFSAEAPIFSLPSALVAPLSDERTEGDLMGDYANRVFAVVRRIPRGKVEIGRASCRERV